MLLIFNTEVWVRDGEIFSALPLHDLSLRTPLLRAPESRFPVPLLAPT